LIRYDCKPGAGIISKIKYDFWEKYQKKNIKNAFEIEYNSLKKHPLWINKKERENFFADANEKSSPAGKIPKNAFLQKDPKWNCL